MDQSFDKMLEPDNEQGYSIMKNDWQIIPDIPSSKFIENKRTGNEIQIMECDIR